MYCSCLVCTRAIPSFIYATLTILRLFWRLYLVLSKPLDELIGLLGLEKPAAPSVSLAGVKADAVILHWKAREQSKGVRHSVHVNGINGKSDGMARRIHADNATSVGQVSPLDPIIAISNLEPNKGYIIRIVTTNESNFQASSDAIRVTTKSAESADFLGGLVKSDEEEDQDEQKEVVPVIRPFKAPIEPAIPTPPAPAMAREHSNSVSQKRAAAAKRQSAPVEPTVFDEPLECEGTLQELTDQLDKLRDENEKIEKLLADEDEEFKESQASLVEQRDVLKGSVNAKEGASRKLRQRVAKLDHENAAASNKKTGLEKQLQQKQQDREKLKTDTERYDQEVADIKAEIERWNEERSNYREETDNKIGEFRDKHASELNANKALEESIKEKVSMIKELEDEKKRLDQHDDAVAQGAQSINMEEEQAWQLRMHHLRGAYAQAWQAFQAAKEQSHQAQQTLEFWMQRRASNPQLFIPSPTVDLVPGRRPSQRRARAPSLRNELSPQAAGFNVTSGPPYSSTMASISPSFPAMSPFFNSVNGMTLPPTTQAITMSQEQMDQLTGGAPTSPSVAGALLPSGLLGDEAEPPKSEPQPPRTGTSSNRNSRAFDDFPSNLLPGLGAAQILDQVKDPSSPVSVQSRSPSVFASPRESSTHLPFSPPGEGLIDSDRRSVRSTTGSARGIAASNSTGTRFATLFGFNRQRGKTFSDEGPALGSLKVAESQSFPRQDLLDAAEALSNRRRGSHSGGWTDSLHGVFSRGSGAASGPESSSTDPPPGTRRSRFSMFSSKTDSWPSALSDRPSSPRQGSTGSSETNLLPRPSTEGATRFGWTLPVDGLGPRHSPLAADWGMTATNSWSRHPSRRPSVQYGSSLSLGQEPSIFEGPSDVGDIVDFSEGIVGGERKVQAPIGTRPSSRRIEAEAEKQRLNPEAKSFKTLFTRGEKKDRGDKAEAGALEDSKEGKEGKKSKKGKTKDKDKAKAKDSPALDDNKIPTTPDLRVDDQPSPSPESSRKSKDAARSISTAGGDTGTEGTNDGYLRESFEALGRQTSHTLSEGQGSTPREKEKESFMQKLSRKSSASMFSLRFSKKAGKEVLDAHDTPEETDEEGNLAMSTSRSGELLRESPLLTEKDGGKPRESKEKEREGKGGFSFRSLTSRGRKGEKERTPSLHESLASRESEAGDGGVGGEEDGKEVEI